jgi:hypothetical protein
MAGLALRNFFEKSISLSNPGAIFDDPRPPAFFQQQIPTTTFALFDFERSTLGLSLLFFTHKFLIYTHLYIKK